MRLRNIKRADGVLNACPLVIKEPDICSGKWNTHIFQNKHPIHVEIGMGKGQFLLTLAARNPQINYVGIERYSSVLLRAVEKLTSDEPDHAVSENIRFLCIDAAMLPQIFSPGEVSRIYLNFSDPWPKARHAGRRLTSKEFFARYDRILAADGQVEFKTDNRRLFDFSAEQLESSGLWEITALTYDLHHDKAMNENNIMTEYEEKFSSYGNPICKLITERKSNRRTCI
ncbi:MAG: tRNA (guanosine(46)-N7)-methyltransferase TrmB [Dorea sp.]|nr:tRNA (guanosine(46)-N7)-methyltransferase TrmB [Dorea sp.]